MIESETKVNIEFVINPFGQIQFKLKGVEEKEKFASKPPVIYGEPTTTNQQTVEIVFGGIEYKTPKTTGGIF